MLVLFTHATSGYTSATTNVVRPLLAAARAHFGSNSPRELFTTKLPLRYLKENAYSFRIPNSAFRIPNSSFLTANSELRTLNQLRILSTERQKLGVCALFDDFSVIYYGNLMRVFNG